MWCRCINSLHNVFTYQCLKKETHTINYKPKICQNAALQLNGMHLNSPSTECWKPCRAASSSCMAWVGNAYARSFAPWPILLISGYDGTTSLHLTFYGMIYDCNTHSRLWYLNFIILLSFVCPKLACIELLITLPNDRHLFADGFVTVRPIAMKFRWDKESVSSLTFWKISLESVKFEQEINDDVQT